MTESLTPCRDCGVSGWHNCPGRPALDVDDICPNCLTPWKCNGPHVPPLDSGEVRVTSSTGGQKGQKQARLGSIDPQALLTMAEVAGFGEQKYSRLNYMNGYPYSLSWDAAQRHLLAFWSGQDLDEESELPHLAHAAWHCLAMLAFLQHGLGEDDRYRPPAPSVDYSRLFAPADRRD